MNSLASNIGNLKLHVNKIEEGLFLSNPDLICKALTDEKAREEIKKIIKEQYRAIANDENIDSIVGEIVGTGIIENIIRNEHDVTDIAFDGNQLEVRGVNYYEVIKDEHIDEVYVQRLVQKFAAALGKEFSPKNPKLNGVYGYFRINAIHSSNTTKGPTFSLRIVRPRLALNVESFNKFAPNFILDFYKAAIEVHSNILIAGRTGTGKTELQKLGLSYTRAEKEKIGIIQDVPELFGKELFPDKIIFDWLVGNGLDHNDLIFEAMRNNFHWIIVSEVINKSAYGLYQAMFSGHSVITTLHSKDALSISRRLAYLAKFAPEASTMDKKEMADEIEEFIDFGFHLENETVGKKDYRYLNEIAAFEPSNSKLMFKQKFMKKSLELHWETGELPQAFKDELNRLNIKLDFPENTNGVINLE